MIWPVAPTKASAQNGCGELTADVAVVCTNGNVCNDGPLVQDEAPDYTCLVGRLAGTDPPLYVDEQLDCVIKQITHEREVTEWNG